MTGKMFSLMAGCAMLAMSGAAYADCAAELAAIEGDSIQGTAGVVSKDGSLAPLETHGAAASDSSADAAEPVTAGSAEGDGEIAKDGTAAPLGASETVAMSPQDVEAQQEGGDTAMAVADQGVTGAAEFATRVEALEAAREALADGDEDRCLEAVEAAKIL